MNDKITLIDGRELVCYPISEPRKDVDSGQISLDTSGVYLSTGSKPRFESDKDAEERRRKIEAEEKLFYRHAHLFLANADKILSDSRLFLTPVSVVSGLAYTGTSGLRNPTLGVYIEWWLHHKDVAIDANGRPIWFISGSPLSGSSACCCVDRKGRIHRAKLNAGLLSVWRTFVDVNGRYTEAKAGCMAYGLQEVIDLLEGHTDNNRLFRLHLGLEKVKYDIRIDSLRHALQHSKETIDRCHDKIRQLLVNQNRKAVEEFYDEWLRLQTRTEKSREDYRSGRIQLRRQLRSGSIDNIDYQKQLLPLRRQAEDHEYEARKYSEEGLRQLFGDDARLFTPETLRALLAPR